MFTAQDVKELRDITDCGMMDCKKALTETDGDKEKAVEILREKGLAKAAKKSGRIAAEGVVTSAKSDDDRVGLILEVNAETDFVAKNEKFQAFVASVANTIKETNPADVETLLDQKCVGNESETIREMLTEKISTIGENMNIRRFARYENDYVETYIHGNGRIGVIVGFKTDVAAKDEFKAYAKDIAMQIAALNATYLNEAAVPAEHIEKEKEILKAQAINEGKPEAIAEKMVFGRIAKFYKENCLLDQEFVKDNTMDVKAYTKSVAAQLGGSIEIQAFDRFEKGEGIEKKEDNLAEEVAKMMK